MMINKSKAYILPLLSSYVEVQFINKINNTYLFLEHDATSYIIVEYKQSDDSSFNDYLIELTASEYCIEIRTTGDNVFCIFSVADSIKEDYSNFILGKFSRISDSNKKKILSFSVSNYGHSNIKIISKIKQILYQETRLRNELEEELDLILPKDSELTSIPNLKKETLKL